MNISDAIFRFRRWVLVLIVGIGLWAPWERMGGNRPGTTWLFLAGIMARHGILSIADSSIAVMAMAIGLALLAALLRTWATAYIGNSVVRDSALHGERVIAAGPYRYVRNPLYLGTWLHMAALAVLMPPGGALFAVTAVAFLNGVKARAEKRHLTAKQGDAYTDYVRRVPGFFFALRPRVPAGGGQARWGNAFLGEIYCWGVFVTYAALATQYNVTLLEQGILISLGVAIVVQGLMRPRAHAEK